MRIVVSVSYRKFRISVWRLDGFQDGAIIEKAESNVKLNCVKNIRTYNPEQGLSEQTSGILR